MNAPNELRVFISSTFRDLQEEREHLVKKIFPEIRALCRERGITFTEVDLRWGLTEEDVALGRVISTCLEEVDKCRPYFIGITGERYGYVPSHLDIQKDPQLLQQYPWIEDVVIEQMSITEMEAHYAVLGKDLGKPRCTNALFYFRRHRKSLEDDRIDDEERRRLEDYQQRIGVSEVRVEHFRDPLSLGEMIYDDLIEIIKRNFADARPPTPLEEERVRHAAFSLSRRRAYIANPAYLKLLNDHAASSDPPLVVYAESGSGKSSLFAFWAELYRRKNPEAHVIEHYVGIGATATDHYAVIRHVCMEINERFGREEDVPSDPARLEAALGQWLGYADYELRKRGERMVLILDGLNQLQGAALGLKWIPDVIAPTIRVILSSTVEGTLMELQKRGWSRFGMQALTEAERETIVVRYLAEYHKALNPEQVKRIASDYKCGHPLFLKTVLEELRLVGRHEELDAKISSYLEATGTEDLFQRVLERLEDDYSLRTVRDVMTLLVASRSGLDERELSEISGIARLKIATMMAGLDYHLVRKEGRLTFFHDYLRRAVEKRHLTDEVRRRAAHAQIAEYFQSGVIASIAASGQAPLRMASELCHQLQSCGDMERLRECLTTIPVFLSLFSGSTQFEVQAYWTWMGTGADVVGMYREGLAKWSSADAEEWSRGVGRVADVLEKLGEWVGAIELTRERLASAMEHGQKNEEASSRRQLGWFLQAWGQSGEAMEQLSEALKLYTELGDRSGISSAIGYIGLVHSSRGEYDRAIDCFEQKLRMEEELGDRHGVSVAIGNLGLMYYHLGEHERALECYQRQLRICEELGDRSGISVTIANTGLVYERRGESDQAMECFERTLRIEEELGFRRGASLTIGSMGNVYSSRGEYDRAIECFERQLRMCEELGDRSGISLAIGNMAQVFSGRGEYDRALECYERQLRIVEELGDRGEVARAIGNMGSVYISRGAHERALESFHRAAEEHRATGFRYGLTYWLLGIGQAVVDLVRAGGPLPGYLSRFIPDITAETQLAAALRYARNCVEECIAISDELSKPDSRFGGRVLLALIEAAEGNTDVAVQCLARMLEDAPGDEQCSDLHYWLWKLGEPGHAAQALALYEVLFAATPNHEYHMHIEELKAAPEIATGAGQS